LLVEEVGEGFHGDEIDKQLTLIDNEGTGKITMGAFVKWYCNLVDTEGDDSSQESEVAEEKAKTEKAFDVLGKGATTIPASDFSKLLESMGTTYCEDEHVRTIKKLSTLDKSGDKVITKNTFVTWYVDGESVDSRDRINKFTEYSAIDWSSPFGAPKKEKEMQGTEESASNAAFPLMSTAAPTNPAATKPVSDSTCPSVSEIAPTPSCASSKNEVPNIAVKSLSIISLPPMSAAAPTNPFVKKTASNSAFLPM